MEQTTPTIRLTFRVVVTRYTLYKGYMPLVSRQNLLVRLRFRHADFKRMRNRSLMSKMTHSSGRVFIILWARALCFLASRLTTVSLDSVFIIYSVVYSVLMCEHPNCGVGT